MAKTLGFEQYELAFRDNGVRAEVLCHLTADDLRELGVTAVGQQHKLLVAIAKLRDGGLELEARSLNTRQNEGKEEACRWHSCRVAAPADIEISLE